MSLLKISGFPAAPLGTFDYSVTFFTWNVATGGATLNFDDLPWLGCLGTAGGGIPDLLCVVVDPCPMLLNCELESALISLYLRSELPIPPKPRWPVLLDAPL